MKKHTFMILALLICVIKSNAQAQKQNQTNLPKCGCPVITLVVDNTKMDFPIDSAEEGGAYAKAENSGDYLKRAYAKQQSDQLKIFRRIHKDSIGTIDFTSNVEIERHGSEGNFTYDVGVRIEDAYRNVLAARINRTTDSLTHTFSMIDSCMKSLSPILDSVIRKYQERLRTRSKGTRWIGLQWQEKPDKKKIKKGASTVVTITVVDCVGKVPVPDLRLYVVPTDPNVGVLSAQYVTTDDSGKASVIFTGRNPGETMVLASFSYTAVNGKVVKNPILCGESKITVEDSNTYKITMEAESVVPVYGKDVKMHGECVASLRMLADSTYMLEPVDKTRNMMITLEKATIVNIQGIDYEVKSPKSYKMPFLFTIGKTDKSLPIQSGHAIVYLYSTGPQSGIVTLSTKSPDGTNGMTVDLDKGTVTLNPSGTVLVRVPKGTSTTYGFDPFTNLNILNDAVTYNHDNLIVKNLQQNVSNLQAMLPAVERIKENMKNPAYFKTAQGKADLRQWVTLVEQIGDNTKNSGPMSNKVTHEIVEKIMSDPDYPGSEQFGKDIALLNLNSMADEEITQKPAMPDVSPGAGMARIEGDFEPNSSFPFSETIESNGAANVSVKITVEKMD